jgi:uncharacterized protein YegL
MNGDPIAALNDGIRAFQQSLQADTLARLRVEVCIVTFGPVQLAQPFISAIDFQAPVLQTTGATPLGEALNHALDQVEDRKHVYGKQGVAYYRPWVFLITDGAPTDGDAWKHAAQRIHQYEADKKVAFFAIGVESADMDTLRQLSTRAPLKLKGLAFQEMFLWLSSSLGAVSRSRPGDTVPLESPSGWGTV